MTPNRRGAGRSRVEVGGPYVGLRPFRREEKDRFFGRERDAQFLCDKVLSARLTVLYARSGLGKSSLLNALVVPQLEEAETRVLHFDSWTGTNPSSDLKRVLIEEARRLGVPDPEAGAPSLTEVVRLIERAADQALVLVFDQFEEFLAIHAHALDPLRKELAELVQAPDLDVQVLLTLREEFLAALEPFRAVMPDLLRSTYRLQPLDDSSLRVAVERPARLFGVETEPALVDRILEDLGGTRDDRTADAGPTAVELPMLQLVCSRLWEDGASHDATTLTLDRYEDLGGAEAILRSYVREIMPKRWKNKKLLARLLTFLAPPSGLKMSYTARDLASVTGLPQPRVQSELTRLSDRRILRVRAFNSGDRYELQHDAFIQVVKPWREAVQNRARRRAWMWRATAAAALVLAASAAFVVYKAERRAKAAQDLAERQREAHFDAVRPLEDLKRKLPARGSDEAVSAAFTSLVSYWQKRGAASGVGRGLLEDLQRYAGLLTQDDAGSLPDNGSVRGPEDPSAGAVLDWPLGILVPPQFQVDGGRLDLAWTRQAQTLTERWGVPVPRSIRFAPGWHLAPDQIRIFVGGAQPFAATVPPIEDTEIVVSTRGLEGEVAVAELLTHIPASPLRPSGRESEGPWWAVPRWTAPVWRFFGCPTIPDREALVASVIVGTLPRGRHPLVSDQALDLLLERLLDTPALSEARRARGDRLHADLRGILEHRSLVDLPEILDALAHYPDASSQDAARGVLEEMTQPLTSPAGSDTTSVPPLNGPMGEKGLTELRRASIEKVDPRDWLRPETRYPIRARMGSKVREVLTVGRSFAADVLDAITAVKIDVLRAYGVEMPEVRYWLDVRKDDIAEDEFRIEFLGNGVTHTWDTAASAETNVAVFQDALRKGVEDWRARWITPAQVHEILGQIPESIRTWLEQHYSLTDLKRILRGVVALPGEGGAGCRLCDPARMLQSLVFWTQVADPRDLPSLTRRLRRMQASRLAPASSASPLAVAEQAVARGITALEQVDVDQALEGFRAALEIGRGAAEQAFLAQYTAAARKRLEASVDGARGFWPHSYGRAFDLLELHDLRTREGDDDEDLEQLRLALLVDLPPDWTKERESIANAMIHAGDIPAPDEGLLPQRSTWFALRVLRTLDASTDREFEVLEEAAELLRESARGLDDGGWRDTLRALDDLAEQGRSASLCWMLMRELAEGRLDRPISARIADLFCTRRTKRDLELALTLTNTAWDEMTPRVERAGGTPAQDFVERVRASATMRLAFLERDTVLRAEAEKMLRDDLLESPTQGTRAHLDLLTLLIEEGSLEKVGPLLDRATEKFPAHPEVWQRALEVRLLRGDEDGVREVLREAVGTPGTPRDWRFVAADALVAPRPAAPDLAAAHGVAGPRRDYILMIRAACTADSETSRRLLRERWEGIWAQIEGDPDRWETLLPSRGLRVWGEILLAYFVGDPALTEKLPLQDIVDALESPDEDLELMLNTPNAGLLAEVCFYQAMRARAAGDEADERRWLERVLEADYRPGFEYKMATYLIERDRVR